MATSAIGGGYMLAALSGRNRALGSRVSRFVYGEREGVWDEL